MNKKMIIEEANCTITIQTSGVIFGRGEFEGVGRTYVEYVDMLDTTNRYLKDWKETFREAVKCYMDNSDTGAWSFGGNIPNVVAYSLVRHGERGFYPLPLLFATPEKRQEAAEEKGFKCPPQRWVNRKRNQVLKELGLL